MSQHERHPGKRNAYDGQQARRQKQKSIVWMKFVGRKFTFNEPWTPGELFRKDVRNSKAGPLVITESEICREKNPLFLLPRTVQWSVVNDDTDQVVSKLCLMKTRWNGKILL